MSRSSSAKNHYITLGVSVDASLSKIKSAYRTLAKQFHPDCNQDLTDHEAIAAINQAYEILGNPDSRAHYDRSLGLHRADHTPPYKTRSADGMDEDRRLERWHRLVYQPIGTIVEEILNQLDEQIELLAADPYDDELLEGFETYLEASRLGYATAQQCFRKVSNPNAAAGVTSYLYHCLNALSDGIEELHYFTLNFDDRHLHTGKELWRRAAEMYHHAQDGMASLNGFY
ncbi:MAG: DnaJ domain-containing protein [Oscillatoriales cyanobacterium SM2_2_1]|nr:DnaJ domain-containing protein [Oscillatoriales cyanobacterium SM2_2_1]